MSFFNIFSKNNINDGVREFRESKNAILLDVRTAAEYESGHIEDSHNLPLEYIQEYASLIPDKDAHVFLHCLSGARSSLAASYLKKKGYKNVHDIGGIRDYKGKLVHSFKENVYA